GVMSLYNHVASKDDMLDGMVDLVASEIQPPASGVDWKTAMRESAISAHQALLAHPWAGSMWSSGWPGPARLHYMESLLRALREADFSAETTYHGFHALNMHISGFTLQELNFSFDDEDLEELAAKFFREVPADEYPYLTEHAREHLSNSEHHDDFEFVLDLILDGLDRVRETD
ncbi:MAG: TetR/AcrR family transcriptional regulator C-terminal domain-containing protein, partial [Acidimicrobiales bacterium]